MTLRRFPALLLHMLLLGLCLLWVGAFATFSGVQQVSALSSSQATSPSFVRIIHASPFVGTADVFVDGAKLLSSFPFGGVTGYATIPPGPHKVQIALVGKGIGASALTETLTVSPGVAYTVAAIGTNPNNLSLQVFVDDNTLSTGTAKVRVYELSPDAGTVTVAAGNQILVNGISYQNASNYLTIPEGSYTFTVSSSTHSAPLTTSTTLNANMVESLFVVGMFNGSPRSTLVTSQATGLPSMPNTGSDPNAIPPVNPVQSQLFNPWLWPLGIASLLLLVAGSGFVLRRPHNRRSGGSR
jgi:hypothetical protein